ncbi:hypothetical protein PZH31_14510, partial [[Ruminococcus] torques]|uniref:hypothetical protein n=1 Tax=[Ruminococcus] torques TaxID=33039 RepID=UPI0023B19019
GIYCRLSKDDGTDNESASIATQKSILTDYVKRFFITRSRICKQSIFLFRYSFLKRLWHTHKKQNSFGV